MNLNRDAIQLYEAWLDLDEKERTSWLDQQLADGDPLREELLHLIKLRTDASGLFAQARQETNVDRRVSIDVGDTIGDFVIEAEIGSGGMGVVYRAHQSSLNRTVALKVLPQHLNRSESARKRFLVEIEAAAKLQHPNIVRVYTSGTEREFAYYAMEYVDGATLADVIRRGPNSTLSPALADHTTVAKKDGTKRSLDENDRSGLRFNRTSIDSRRRPSGA